MSKRVNLSILVHHELADHPLWAELREKGDTVVVAYSDSHHCLVEYDYVAGPNVWQVHLPLMKYVPAGLALARRRKGGKHASSNQ